jgi:hypothetical protein
MPFGYLLSSLVMGPLSGVIVPPSLREMKKSSLFYRCLCFVFAALTAFATTNNCPVTTGSLSRTFTGGPTYSGVIVPGSTTGNPLSNSLSALGAVGCTAIDLNFSNFAVSSSGTNENALPSLAGTYVSVTPTGTTQTGPDTLLFATLQGDGTGVDTAQNDGVDNYKVNNSETFTTTQSYAVTDSVSTGIFEVLLTVNDITIAAGGSGSFSIDTCLKGTGTANPTGNITSQTACNTAVGGNRSLSDVHHHACATGLANGVDFLRGSSHARRCDPGDHAHRRHRE